MKNNHYVLWGSELSPFYLKVLACLQYHHTKINFQPQNGHYFKALYYQLKVQLIQAGLIKITWPQKSTLDELPLVPYMFNSKGQSLYDSSAFAHYLDKHTTSPVHCLCSFDNNSVEFLIALIDEYADEFGLYMVHHMRWKYSATDNTAGSRLANEFKTLLGPFNGIIANSFPKRQVRRLPYLFSVAPKGFAIDKLPKVLQPPIKIGFPATHKLLENSYDNLLDALELLFAKRPYILGNAFTLADASIYGQLSMNLTDPSANQHIIRRAPNVHAWLIKIQQSDFQRPDKVKFEINEDLAPLLMEIQRTFIPLMQQNHQAYKNYLAEGHDVFNENAFNKGEALYEGLIDGEPFKSVVKSFQVASWQDIVKRWNGLSDSERQIINDVTPLKI